MIVAAATATLQALAPGVAFSIAVPIRHHVGFLDTALRSIEAQNADVDLAVLDATDDDRAQKILDAHRVSVGYAYHHADAGQAAAIDEGWTRTKGDVLGWLNVDDFYFRGALDRVAAVFEAQPEVDVVFGHAVHVTADCDFLTYFPAIDPDPRWLVEGCTICQPSCFIRRRAVERVGGLNTGRHYTMDWDLWLRLYRAGCRFAFLDAPLSVVRIHPDMKTLSRAPDRYREIESLLTTARVTQFRKLRTLLSFYKYDLQNHRPGAFDQTVYGLLSLAARARLRRRRRRVILGIECWTNIVRGGCRVEVPRYSDEPAADITVICDRPIALAFRAGQCDGTLEARGTTQVVVDGETVHGYQYAGRVPLCDSTLSVALNAGRESWRLLRVNVS